MAASGGWEDLMKTTIRLGAAVLAMALSAATAEAQQAPYPNRPITWVVPFGAGGVTDNSARFVAKVLSEKIGQPVIVENKPGAAGIVGAEYVAQAKPDGYTMLYASSGPRATFVSLYKKLSFTPLKSFIPVNGMGDSSLLLVVNASKPYKTVEEFIDYLKKNPGKVNFGSAGAGTAPHLIGEMFQIATGTSMVHVPYKVSANLYADLLSGTIDAIFDYTVVMRPHIEAGKVIPLGISREDRLKSFPNVPTFKERGLEVVLTAWSSIAMPAGTPPEIVNKMSAAFAETSRDPTVIKYNEDNDFGNLGHLGPEKLKEFYISETAKFKTLVEKAGVSLD
jgi:tripartite-type tricarboxylate transporter receptor subunit TctC